MWKCPVCGSKNLSAIVCPQCGFDESCDYIRYPTVSRVQKFFTPERRKRAGLVDVTEAYIQYLNMCMDAVNSGEAHFEAKTAKEKLNRLLADTIAACNATAFAVPALTQNVIIPAGNYRSGTAVFETLARFEDAAVNFKLCAEFQKNARLESAYQEAVRLEKNGETARAAMTFYKLGGDQNAKWHGFALWKKITPKFSAGGSHTVALKVDGTVVAVGKKIWGQCNVSGWMDIVAISAGGNHTVGLKADGTVVAVGYNDFEQCNVSGWTDITAISAGSYHTVGLKADGTVAAVGYNDYGQCDVSDWTDIVAISAGDNHTVGLKADGRVIAVGKDECEQCNVSDWMDIVAISAGYIHTVGLKADGTVVAVGYNGFGQCNVFGWTDIAAISAGGFHTVGLKADGTVVAVGYNDFEQCNVSGWTDITAISAGSYHTVGLKADGTVVAVGKNNYGQCDVSGWTDIRLP